MLRSHQTFGALVCFDLRDQALHSASAWDMLVVYTLVYYAHEDYVFVVDLFIWEWASQHTDDPFPSHIR